MIVRPMSFAAQITRMWVALYTLGMRSKAQHARREEIESDLWEQAADEELAPSGWESFARLILGIPADLTWRFEQRGAQEETDQSDAESLKVRSAMFSVIRGNWLTAIVVLFAGFTVVYGVSIFIRFLGDDADGAFGGLFFGLGAVLAAGLMLTGFFISKRSPWRGAALLTLGAVMIAAVHFWMFPIYVPVALVVIGFGIARARKFARLRETSMAA